jgi:hypothetical protein
VKAPRGAPLRTPAGRTAAPLRWWAAVSGEPAAAPPRSPSALCRIASTVGGVRRASTGRSRKLRGGGWSSCARERLQLAWGAATTAGSRWQRGRQAQLRAGGRTRTRGQLAPACAPANGALAARRAPSCGIAMLARRLQGGAQAVRRPEPAAAIRAGYVAGCHAKYRLPCYVQAAMVRWELAMQLPTRPEHNKPQLR